MRKTPRSAKLAALLSAGALVFAACGSDSDDTATEDSTEETTAEAAETTVAEVTEDTEAEEVTETTEAAEPAAEAAMRITYDINPDAVWDDGTPITAADFQCTYDAIMNSVGSLTTAGYDQIISVEAGESDKQVVIDFSTVYAPYKGLFNPVIKADVFADCNDISGDLQTEFPFSAQAMKLESWSPEQSVFVPNENYWGEPATVERVVMVPKADSDTEIASIKAGEVDFIYPQFYSGIEDALADPNIKVSINFGGDYEALYFQQQEGPFADPDFRKAFSLSIDREALFQQIYVPLVDGAELLQCGPIVPGKWCNDSFADVTYDQAAADQILTDAGWAKDGSGYWAKDGVVPEIRWMVNSGNVRRESTQAYLIPLLQAAGFNVIADNCEAECVFQQRLPSLDYDLGMYISTAPPDPQYLTSSFACDQIPTEENDFAGQNSQGWCNEDATAALYEADATVDEAARIELIHTALDLMAEDSVLLPLFQFPKSGAYRTDRVGGTVEDELNNYQAFRNFPYWTDVDGDGQIIIGAEQWPGCLNPITECANSSWYVWTVSFALAPGVYDTTNDGDYELTELMASEPVVEVLAEG